MSRRFDLLERSRAVLATRKDNSPDAGAQPGDLICLPARGDSPTLLWALLRRSLEGEEQWIAAPVDVFPALGSRDVALKESPGDPRVLRGFRVRISLPLDWQGRWRGRVPRAALDAARENEKGDVQGFRVGGPTEGQQDDDPEYQDWIESVLLPAAERIDKSLSAAVTLPTIVRTRTSGPVLRNLALAASLLIAAVALAVAWVQNQRARGLEEALLAAQKLPGLVAESPIAQIPFTWLSTGNVVRNAAPAEVEALEDRPFVLLLIEVPDIYSRFTVRVESPPREPGAPPLTWQMESIAPSIGGELPLLVPAVIIRRGTSRLSLYGERGTQLDLVLQRELRAKSSSRR